MKNKEYINELIIEMKKLGYEYDNDNVVVLFTNIEDGSDLTFGNWDEVEEYVKNHH